MARHSKRTNASPDTSSVVSGSTTPTKFHENGTAKSESSPSRPKKMKVSPVEVEVQLKEEDEFNEEFVEHINADAQSLGDINYMYTQDDLQQLASRIRKQLQAIPRSEQMAYTMTFDKIDFEKIKFNSYSADDCKIITKSVFKFLRKIRNMAEMLNDFEDFIGDGEKFNRYQKDLAGPLKKPPTPCIMFINENRQQYREMYPNETQAALYKIMSEKFKKLPAKKKQKFVKMHEQRLEEYKKQLEDHFQSHPEAYVAVSKKPKHRNNNLPERPQKPIQFYLTKQLRQYDPVDQENKDLIESIKQQFVTLSEKKKLKYIRKAVRDEERYVAEMECLIASNPELEVPRAWRKTVLTRQEQALLYKSEGRPEKPPNSGYVLYSSIILPELGDIQARERMIIIARRWSELDPAEKEIYNERAAKMNEQYHIDFEAYLKTLDPEKAEELKKQEKTKSVGKKVLPAEVLKAGKLVYRAERMKSADLKNKIRTKKEMDQLMEQEWDRLTDEERSSYIEKGRNYELYNSVANEMDNKRGTKSKELGKFTKKFGLSYQVNSFSLFMMENIDSLPGDKATQRMKEVSEKWKSMSNEEKEFYKIRNDAERKVAEEMLEEYNREIEQKTVNEDAWNSPNIKGKEFRERVVNILKQAKFSGTEKPFPIKQLCKINPIYKDIFSTPMKSPVKAQKKATTTAFNGGVSDDFSDY